MPQARNKEILLTVKTSSESERSTGLPGYFFGSCRVSLRLSRQGIVTSSNGKSTKSPVARRAPGSASPGSTCRSCIFGHQTWGAC